MSGEVVACGCGGPGLGGERPFGTRREQRVYALARIELRDGQTQSDEVKRLLGEPDYRNADGTFIAYHWELATGHVTKQGRVSRNRLEDDPTRYLLVMQFNAAGFLARHKQRRLPVWRVPSSVFDNVARRWGASSEPPSTQPKPPDV